LSRESRTLIEAGQTLGAAFLAGLQPHAHCLRGKRSAGPVKIEPCGCDAVLDLESLIWMRGAKFPCWRLSHRLRCPRCGGMGVEFVWLPAPSPAVRAGRDLFPAVEGSMTSEDGQTFKVAKLYVVAHTINRSYSKAGVGRYGDRFTDRRA
jgi:hypothetical protein